MAPASSKVFNAAAVAAAAGFTGSCFIASGPALRLRAPVQQPSGATADAARTGRATLAATAAVALAAAAVGKASKRTAVRAVWPGVGEGIGDEMKEAERQASMADPNKFAGGLLGGQSAFSSFEYNFDPMGLSKRVPILLPWFREAELKHGRVAMLAFLGLIVPDLGLKLPGPAPCFTSTVLEAHNACVGNTAVMGGYHYPFLWSRVEDFGPLAGGLYIVGFIEILTTMAKATNITSAPGLTLESAGDYQLGLNFLPKDAGKAQEMRLKELKNARLAMIAFAGAVTQAALTGNSFPWLYAEKNGACETGLSSSLPAAAKATRSRSAVTRNAYKMSKAVPFLPLSPALEGMVGAEEEGFDPMGFSLALDIRWLREAEIKHGRVAMLATAGWIATDLGLRVPGKVFEVSTLDAHDALVKLGVMPHMLIWFGAAEFFGFLATIQMLEGNTDRAPGDFYLRTLYPSDPKGQYDMQLKELRNGRLAMLAIGGIATVAVESNSTWPLLDVVVNAQSSGCAAAKTGSAFCGATQAVRTSAVARKAEGEAARPPSSSASIPFLQKPTKLEGYVGSEIEFDPVCFSDFYDMKWLREAELKHGRVAMMASVGFLAQQFITFPGLTPAPDALQAPLTAPVSVMASLAFVAGFIESSSYGGKLTMLDMFKDTDRDPGNFNFGSNFLNGKSEKDVRDMKLKELSNGRLAMFAIGGMIHHNLVVKGPLFPLIPDNWEGPFGTWQLNSVMSGLQEVYPKA